MNEVESLDTYDIPGDLRGASGLDSSLFAHVKRNWLWVSSEQHSITPTQRKDSRPPKSTLKPNEKVVKIQTPVKRGTKRKQPEPDPDMNSGVPFPSRPKPASHTRKIFERKKAAKKPYYDEIDKEALKLMIGMRVDWSKEEDTFLLLARVAGSYLCQYMIAAACQMVPYTIVRDELHSRYALFCYYCIFFFTRFFRPFN